MCPSFIFRGPTQEHDTVAVFDLKSNHLGQFPSTVVNEKASPDPNRPSFERATIPRFGTFDIFASNESNDDQPPYHKIITRANQDTRGSSFVARLNYGGLGTGANIRRVFTSSKHRVIYIGSVS
ncbi:hypothetical protein DL95DRAFT_485707 [Leptodontidium sp. 2 PMI_412]|nr:hypothetical protein DL95DRAFT_485707 [Leptodontidium sp. 2 PMI_412]